MENIRKETTKEESLTFWLEKQKELEKRPFEPLFHEKEIWWCALGINIGSEQNGKNELFERPVLVIKKYHKDMLLILPLTSSDKSNQYYFTIGNKSAVILSQMRTISSKRLLRKISMISTKEYILILFRLMGNIISFAQKG